MLRNNIIEVQNVKVNITSFNDNDYIYIYISNNTLFNKSLYSGETQE